MRVWHLSADTPRLPHRVSPDDVVRLTIGTWPIEPGQAVWVTYRVAHADGRTSAGQAVARWQRNEGVNSYWQAEFGPFAAGDHVTYSVAGRAPDGEDSGPALSFPVGPALYLALLWHQHQPIYRDYLHPTLAGSYRQPWVRLHAIRDYYAMAALVADHPDVHVTFSLTPALLWQLDDYIAHGATDRALDLTLAPAEALTDAEREELLGSFFDADWHNQIFPAPRYHELFRRRQAGQPFSAADLRDLQMWSNLAWFGHEFRVGMVTLITGEVASVKRFVAQERAFSPADVAAMVAEQYKIMRAVIPLHRHLQERGQIEVSTTPGYHPILPLLVDTDQATIDRPGSTYPPRFAYPEDAEAQVRLGVAAYERYFGRSPRGMWPAEGAVSQAVIPYFARHGIRWLASDQGVLARSGRWGYRVDDPDVLCQPYRAVEGDSSIAIFFRDTALSDHIGFHYHGYADEHQAARHFLEQIRQRFVRRLTGDADRVLTVVLDGENAWGAYREDARPFLRALYGLLERDPAIRTVTFDEYLSGNPARQVAPHPLADQPPVHDLFTGSWIDENGSAPGVDLGTWIGEAEENRAWELLGQARAALRERGATPTSAPAAFAALYRAEGSDWFWWLGEDQASGHDHEFDDLFRSHLKAVYRGLGLTPPPSLDQHLVPRTVIWTIAQPDVALQPGDQLRVRTNCPGVLIWRLDGDPPRAVDLVPVGGAMAGVRRYHQTLGPFGPEARMVWFRFRCTHPDCEHRGLCAGDDIYGVPVVQPANRR